MLTDLERGAFGRFIGMRRDIELGLDSVLCQFMIELKGWVNLETLKFANELRYAIRDPTNDPRYTELIKGIVHKYWRTGQKMKTQAIRDVLHLVTNYPRSVHDKVKWNNYLRVPGENEWKMQLQELVAAHEADERQNMNNLIDPRLLIMGPDQNAIQQAFGAKLSQR